MVLVFKPASSGRCVATVLAIEECLSQKNESPAQCGVLRGVVQQAVEKAKDKAPMSDVECKMLGLPKPVELGRVVELQEEGG